MFVFPKNEIYLAPGDQLQILSVEAKHSRGWYLSVSGFDRYKGIGKVFSVTQNNQLILQKDGKKVAVFKVMAKENIPFQTEAGS